VTIDLCRDWRGAIGAAALGRIDPGEEIGLRAHLDGCAECRASLRELTAVAGVLSAVTVESAVGTPAEPSDALASRVLQRVAHERDVLRTRRTRRLAAGTTAFASAAAAVIALVLVFGGGSSSGTHVQLLGAHGAQAGAVLHAQPIGTAIDVKVSGLPAHHYYWLWLTGEDEHRLGAGTFSGRPQSTDLSFTAAIPLSKARRIWVTDEHDKVVLDAFLPKT
jgi:anti-sigma factor RsiW